MFKNGVKAVAHSNNEAEYLTLEFGLQVCLSHGVCRLRIRGDALLVVKQVLGVWKSKNVSLKEMCFWIKGLLENFESWSLRNVDHSLNEEAHDMAQGSISEVFVLKADAPL